MGYLNKTKPPFKEGDLIAVRSTDDQGYEVEQLGMFMRYVSGSYDKHECYVMIDGVPHHVYAHHVKKV